MRALISVWDKTGIADFAAFLVERGWTLISSGGTARALGERGIPVTPVEEVTSFPEILDGRVKTLHPAVHGGILAREDQMGELAKMGIQPIDMVVVNLYPFEEEMRRGAPLSRVIEMIDIGGVALIRAAAKNFHRVAVVTSPEQYGDLMAEMEERGDISMETRKKLALEAFALTARYDAVIHEGLWAAMGMEGFPPWKFIYGRKVRDLRYGENPHQSAALYSWRCRNSPVCGEVIQGKPLSYNNIVDLDAALNLVREFERPAAAVIKHTNPCGAAVADTLKDAYVRALSGDPVSAFGGIVALNRPLDGDTAREIKKVFTECIVAPDFTDEALEVFKKRKNLRLVKVGDVEKLPPHYAYRSVYGGFLIQDSDIHEIKPEDLKVVSEREPTEEEMRDLLFAWKVVRHVKSNAIVFAKDETVVGVGAGQMSRVDSVQIAARKAGDRARGAVMASDAFFPFRDAIDAAHEAGITAVIQPGGSKRDQEVIEAVNDHGMAMVFTGFRVFRH